MSIHDHDDRLKEGPGAPEPARGGPKDLGDIIQVTHIVAAFVGDLLADADLAEELCYRMARVFTGQEPGYTPLLAWNIGRGLDEPPGIIRHLTEEIQGLPAFPRHEETVATAFGVLANRILDTHEEEGDGPEWERRSANLVRMFSRILVGVPQLPTR